MARLAADGVLVLHFAFVSFVVGGLAAIWCGTALHWQWVRNRRFRLVHLAAILFVTAEALAGIACPLTVWEDALRGTAGDRSFIARMVHSVMFYHLPEWMFTLAYVLFAAVVALTLWLIPPQRAQK